MKNIQIIIIILTLTILSCTKDKTSVQPDKDSCEIENPVVKGERMLGIDLLDVTESNTFDQNIALANELGVEFIALHVPWSNMETSPNTYNDPGNAIELLGQVAVANGYKFSLTIRPIDLTGKTVPSDLDNTRFNTSEIISRFKSLVDFIFTKVDPNVLLNLQVGNEIDGYDTTHEPSSFWDDYKIFLEEITTYVHSLNSDVKVGFTGAFHGLMQNASLYNSLLESVDILGVTYYPLNSDFSVKEPFVVSDDFKNLVDVYGSKPIYLQEVGYQTSATNNSSETIQSEFFCNVFKAWDLYQNDIKTMNIVRLNDLSQQEAQSAAGPYGISNSQFTEYLRTLGIRSNDGTGENKQAFETIKNNASERGW